MMRVGGVRESWNEGDREGKREDECGSELGERREEMNGGERGKEERGDSTRIVMG